MDLRGTTLQARRRKPLMKCDIIYVSKAFEELRVKYAEEGAKPDVRCGLGPGVSPCLTPVQTRKLTDAELIKHFPALARRRGVVAPGSPRRPQRPDRSPDSPPKRRGLPGRDGRPKPAASHRPGDDLLKMSNSDMARNGLGAVLEYMRARALAYSAYDPDTGLFTDQAKVWENTRTSLEELHSYMGHFFSRLAFRKYSREGSGIKLDAYVTAYMSRQQYILMDLKSETIMFKRTWMQNVWEDRELHLGHVELSPTHTSAFKVSFYNAATGKPVPRVVVDWARKVVNGTAWIHSSHLKISQRVSGVPDGCRIKAKKRSVDATSITGRTICPIPRDAANADSAFAHPTTPHSPPKRMCQ